jgi:8-oxo-dGTP pyrophosphatase MutT (NUDIX family)
MDFKARLFAIKNIENPGWEIQKRMAPAGRNKSVRILNEETLRFKRASVLICFCKITSQDGHILMIKRKGHPSDPHASQMAFPGGSVEPYDQTDLQTALREFREETGIHQEPHIIKQLSPLPIPVSKYVVQPYVGFLENEFDLNPNAQEVELIFQIPFTFFKNDLNRGIFNIENAFHVPGWNYENQIIWGASAMMLEELIYILS